jgi:hypothetical protein
LRRLFTAVPLAKRLTENKQSLLSWLLRIKNAQEHPQLHLPVLTQDQIKRARRERQRAAKEAQRVQLQRQGIFLTEWCKAAA